MNFWYSRNLAEAFPSVSVPTGQRYVEFEFEDRSEIVQAVPGNIKLRVVESTLGNDPDAIVNRTFDYFIPGSTLVNSGKVNFNYCELLVNNFFTTSQIHDATIRKIAFNVVRIHRYQKANATNSEDCYTLNCFKWPIESITVLATPNALPTTALSAVQGKFPKFNKQILS